MVVLTDNSLQILGMHPLGPDDRWELVLLATGEYGVRRAMSVLTGARCAELGTYRSEGRTSTQMMMTNLVVVTPRGAPSLSNYACPPPTDLGETRATTTPCPTW